MIAPSPLPEHPDDALHILTSALAEIAPRNANVPRDAALAAFRRYVARVQHHVQELFESANMPGLRAGRLLGELTDGVIAAAAPIRERSGAGRAAGSAGGGGDGRVWAGVLAPFSDIDLLFITSDDPAPATLAVVEFMLYFLWDLGLKVGHATRSVDDCLHDAERDMVIRTSMIDARLLTGDAALFEAFSTRFVAFCRADVAGAFLAAKQAERDARHHRYGDKPVPGRAEHQGGSRRLRDLQTLYWMSRYVFGTQVMGELVGPDSPGGGILTAMEAKHTRRSWSFLWTVRSTYTTSPGERRIG